MGNWKWTRTRIFFGVVMTVLCIACLPANPLVLTGVLKTSFHLELFIIGWAVWALGMALVLTPVIMFPRHGGAPGARSFADTTALVDRGVYAAVRHPQYLGGILSVFVTTLLWYPHWLFGVLGVIGTAIVYLNIVDEEKHLVEQFGEKYVRYAQRVPRLNLAEGIIRLIQRRESRQGS